VRLGSRPPLEGLTDLKIRRVETGNGHATQSYNEIRALELWLLPPGGGQDDVCTAEGGPWARGEARVVLKDIQDPEGTFLSKIHGQGKVETATGEDWHYSWTTLVSNDENGDNHVVQEFNLQST
jgi:hypothetical protein